MSDPTTEGYTVSAAEIEGMVRNLCAYALGEPDPLQRYADLTHQQVLFDGIVAAIQLARGRALADLVVSGMPVEQVAAKTNLATVPRVRKLISVAGETERVKAAAAAAKPKKAKAAPVAEPPEPDPESEPSPEPEPEPRSAVAPTPVAESGKRMLTAAEREALGLPVDGPRPAAAKRGVAARFSRRRAGSGRAR
ncbi:hypothetical protein Cme02nite_38930 [Catellatospora methionotrophica]|uniref:Uncharacterized protein n=1 Tax=Catellatospora methionotrophica TaxID=121620 RepID=A0A8J3LI39_9ACTN|nr:hypothetical protein [Catellatospora methionotrophica]GIG15561.1 hypothetical protein Cme02nite_38930 [Catellatospora methionotrophica]